MREEGAEGPPGLGASRPAPARLALTIRGRVQGVGFRPQAHRVATALGFSGHVRNGAAGVLIEIEGEAPERFLPALMAALPPLARVDAVEAVALPPRGEQGNFAIRDSVDGEGSTALPADAAICQACLGEMFTRANRRWRHAFIACTDCGPRFTMTRRLPYDRPQTTMGAFPLCETCQAEYDDPADRRFHAEAIACPACGPRLSHDIAEVAAAIRAGGIVALKGLGGYHLICDARDAAAVATLRARKRRDGKPLAVMVAGLGAARRLARLDAAHEAALLSPERPIVIAPLAQGARLAQGVTQGLPTIGLFLPTTPAQALIFHDLAGQPEGTAWMAEDDHALVMTSANLSGEPIVIDDDEARARLPALADLIVAHDREILVRADDSVVTIIAGAPALIRRARGHAPERVRMPRALPPALGVGAHLKATACLIEGDGAVLTAHLGDLDTPSAIAGHADAVAHLTGLIRAAPRVIGHDLHPDLAATRYAARRGEGDGLPLVGVQHHHAHAAAVAAEHGVLEGYLGLVLDGVGYGPGGAIWGGELLAIDGASMRRLGHLAPIALPGGDIAAREPWRVAAGLLHTMGRADAIATRFAAQKQAALLAQNLPAMAAPMTSSAGRLFDAAAALLGVAEVNRFEGEAAMRLEALVARPRLLEGGSVLHGGMLDVGPLMHALADEREARRGAELFHGTLIAGLTALTLQTAEAENRDVVALGGGCFLNRWLSEGLMDSLTAAGLRPLLPRALPCNDGAIAFGQAVVAALALERAESPRPGR